MARSLPRSLAPLVEDLELDQPDLVTMPTLRALIERHHVATPPKVVAARLRTYGWLLDTGTRGVWEFAPGAHAGPISRGNPTLPLTAALSVQPGLPAALALSSAAWAHGYADRAPTRLDVAVPTDVRAPASLARATRVTSFTSRLPVVTAKGVPTHQPASILVHAATTPAAVRSWHSAIEWLPDLAAELEAEPMAAELVGRSTAARVRAGYLLSGLRPDLAELVRGDVGGVVRFGSRIDPVHRHSSFWRVQDSALPTDPTTWKPVAL